MTPNFTLSLSFDGIKLMHRVSGGWHLVGEAALEDPDLTGTLARLRQTALALEPGGLRTKLLLPSDQIKFLSIDTTMTSHEDIEHALHGATPYAIEELVIDYNRSGGRTHIAAVARETLAEAEAFAIQHKFSPITFAAVADDYTFNTEVFFGMTNSAPKTLGEGVVVERDALAVVVVGHTQMPEPPQVPEPLELPEPLEEIASTQEPDPRQESEPQQEPEQPEEPVPPQASVVPEVSETPVFSPEAEIAQADVDAIEPEPELSFRRAPDVSPMPADPPTAAPTSEPNPSPAVEEPILSFTRSTPLAADTLAEKSTPEVSKPILPEIDEPVFASRQRAEPTSVPSVAQTTSTTAAPAISELPPEPVFARNRDAALTPGIADIPVSEPDAPAVPKPIIAQAPSALPPPPTAAPTAAPNAAPAGIPVPKPTPATKAPRTSGVAATAGGFLANRRARRTAKVAAKALPPGVGTLGGKHATQIGGKPKHLGLMLTAGLLLFLAIVALWANTLSENGIAGLLGFGDDEGTVITATETGAASEPIEQTSEATQPIIATAEVETATPAMPIVTTVPGRVLSPGEADRIYAATGVWQRAPRLPDLPEATSLAELRLIAASQIVPTLSRPLDLVGASQGIEALFLAPPNPAPAGTIIPRDEDGFILATAGGTVLPNGVLVYARSPQITPPTRPNTSVAAAATVDPATADPATDPAAAIQNATAATVAAALAASQSATDVTAETAAASAAATANVLALPEIAPLARPEALENVTLAIRENDQPVTDETDAASIDAADTPLVVDPALAGIRPSLRPAGLAPEPPFADPTLAGLRPSLRPADLGPATVVETDDASIDEAVAVAAATPDINSVIATIAAAAPPSALVSPTRQAIVASPRPDPRPNNFARVVASAQARQQTQPASSQSTQAPAPAVASSAAATPTGSVPRSVADAATQDSTINLRNVNLIGVYGRSNDRRALVRLTNGRYVKVEVGTSFQGGRITVIGDSALNYVVGGQTYSLQVPAS